MTQIWIVSDTHFGHEKTCTVFKREDGTPLRPFGSTEEMDEEMVRRWNDRVRPGDKVYHLGDVAIARRHLNTLSRLNGDKVLIKGNHDIFRIEDYTRHFRDVRAYHVLNGMIMSHVPVHEESLSRFGANIHGHTHANRVMRFYDGSHTGKIDPRYLCVCVEHTDYAPISMEDVVARVVEQGGRVGFADKKTAVM